MAERIALSSSEAAGADKRVTWVELYFDLVFVFALTQVAGLLTADHSVAGVARALVVFVALWWGWVGTSIHADVRDVDSPAERLGILAAGLPSFLMALAVPGAYGSRGLLFGAAYLALGAVLVVLFFRGRLLSLNPYTLTFTVAGPLLVLGGLLPNPARLAVWALVAAVNLAGPLTGRRGLRDLPIHPQHLTERFGLVLIIALGESLVAIGLSTVSQGLGAARLVAVGLGYAIAGGLWWVYFAVAAPALRAEVLTSRRYRWNVWMLNYGHHVLVAGVLGVAVGLEHAIGHPTDRLPVSVAGLLLGGAALYLLGYGGLVRLVARRPAPAAVVAAGCCLAVLAAAPFVPALASLAAVLAILTALGATGSGIIAGWPGSRASRRA